MRNVLLSTAYFAPVQYYAKLRNCDTVLIERYENYLKQTYRNRCQIYGANKTLMLSVPVVRGAKHKIPINELEVSYAEDWQKQHWRSIVSAYKNSAYFDFYADDLKPLFEQHHKWLLDLNHAGLELTLRWLGLSCNILYTQVYKEAANSGTNDFRDVVSPKKDFRLVDPLFEVKAYLQVFSERNGFVPNLSILDLLFNEGPNAMAYL